MAVTGLRSAVRQNQELQAEVKDLQDQVTAWIRSSLSCLGQSKRQTRGSDGRVALSIGTAQHVDCALLSMSIVQR